MESKFTFTNRTIDNVVILDCDGYFNQLAGEKVAEFCYRQMETGHKNFLLNLEKSTVVNSIGVSTLIEIIEKCRQINGKIGYFNLTPIVAKTFKIMGLLDYSKIYTSEADALLFLNTK